MELRQLRYFVTLAEELNFRRAAEREHIVQSALSQQISRLERELRTTLFERSTHHVCLTSAGEAFLIEARSILCQVERAKAVALGAATVHPELRVGINDPAFDTMPQLLRAVQREHPDLVIHRYESGVPEQCKLLAESRLDVGFGRASQLPHNISSEVIRLDQMGVLVGAQHRFAKLKAVPITELKTEHFARGTGTQGTQAADFVKEMCRAAGFTPAAYPGRVQSVRGAAELVATGLAIACLPRSCGVVSVEARWVPLVDPVVHYPWSLLWRAGDQRSAQLVLSSARKLAHTQGWLDP